MPWHLLRRRLEIGTFGEHLTPLSRVHKGANDLAAYARFDPSATFPALSRPFSLPMAGFKRNAKSTPCLISVLTKSTKNIMLYIYIIEKTIIKFLDSE